MTRTLAIAASLFTLCLSASANAEEVRELSLQGAIEVALRNNLGLQIQRQETIVAQQGLRDARSQFDFRLNAGFNYSRAQSPSQSTVDGAPGQIINSDSQNGNLTLTKPLTFGTTLTANFSGLRSDSSGQNSFRFFNTGTSIGLRQPLLQGFSFDGAVPRSSVILAEFDTKKQLLNGQVSATEEVRRVEQAYWDLVGAYQTFEVQKNSLELARSQYDLTKKQIDAGILAPSDLIASESTVAQRELALVQNEASLQSTADALRSLLNIPEEEWGAKLVPTDVPNAPGVFPDVQEAFQLALSNRPEVKQNEIDNKTFALQEKVASNGKLPALDFNFNYGIAGQGSIYRDSLSQLQTLDARDWSMGLQLTWTPQNNAAKAAEERTRANNQIRKLRYERFLLELRTQVRDAVRQVITAEKRVVASERFRQLALQSLDAERKRFINGKSRNLEVSRREEELARAQNEELQARIDLMKATTSLDQVTGVLLDKKNINLRLVNKGR